MTDLFILHHHDPSPFAEKIRKAFGVKGLSWASVQIPMIVPKPDLTCLTGGYRGTPVLQIGADIYCDTRLIADVIEKLHPHPPLFISGPLVNFGLQHWSDDAVFPPGAALAMHENAANLPDELLDERRAYFTNLDFSRFAEDADHFRSQFQAHATLIDEQLQDSRLFLLGDAPEWADIGAYFNIWMGGGHIPSAERLITGLDRLAAWRARMDAFGMGERTDITADEAIAIARQASPASLDSAENRPDETGAAPGDRVIVWPVDHSDTPVEGTLALISAVKIVVIRSDERAGELAVHFPRIGYQLRKAG